MLLPILTLPGTIAEPALARAMAYTAVHIVFPIDDQHFALTFAKAGLADSLTLAGPAAQSIAEAIPIAVLAYSLSIACRTSRCAHLRNVCICPHTDGGLSVFQQAENDQRDHEYHQDFLTGFVHDLILLVSFCANPFYHGAHERIANEFRD